MAYRNGSITRALIWMLILSVLLFWLPGIGPFIAGLVGGRKAGGVGNAIIAALLPAIIFGIALFFLASLLTGFPLLGMAAGAGGFALAAVHVGPLILGAILGAVL